MSTNPGSRPFFEQFLDDYFAECEEHLTSARKHILAMDLAAAAAGTNNSVLDELLRSFHSLKGLSAMVGVDEATQLAHHIEDYLRELKRPGAIASNDGVERVLAGIDAIERVLAVRRKSEPPPEISMVLLQLAAAAEETRSTPEGSAAAGGVRNWRFEFRPSRELAEQGITVGTVRDRLRTLGPIIHTAPLVLADGVVAFEFILATSASEAALETLRSQGINYSPATAESGGGVQAPPQQAVSVQQAPGIGSLNVVRVEMSRLDDLMRIVGELVISRFRLDEVLRSHSPENSTQSLRALHELNLSMERQIRELREGVMHVRMVPIGQVFERMRFVVRGMERDAGKHIEVQIEGQDTEIDKVIVDRMMDPLLHLVRNAISHGLEPAEERIAAGKPATGSISLAASANGDTVLVEVQDDGRGLNLEKIEARARSLDLIRRDESLDAGRLLDVISAAGFTTREKADLASGRGVGMAAVHATVNELGGSITVDTKPGRGTRFAIRLPLTLLIADSLLVTVGQQRFAVPQTAVREVVAIESSAVRIFENNEIIPFRNSVLPILRLRKFFGLNGPSFKRLHLLVVENGGSPFGLVVDRITGQREIVVRAITDPLLQAPGIVAATELGDGRPILILDPHSLIRAAQGQTALENGV